MEKKFSTVCRCGKVYVGYPNIAGKLCSACGEFIPPSRELDMVKENKRKMRFVEKLVRASIRKKFGLNGEEENANFNR
jgi:hypothetical protein